MWRSGAGVGSTAGAAPLAEPSRHHGIGARLKYMALPCASSTVFTTLGFMKSPTESISWAAVLIAASAWVASVDATASISAGSISGSSP